MSLILDAQALEPAAWADMFAFYRPLVSRWIAYEGVSCPDEIDNFCQEAFVHAVKGIQNFEKLKPGHTFRGWFRRITQNIIRTARRNSSRNGMHTIVEWDWSRVQDVAFEPNEGEFFDSISDEHPDEKKIIYRQIVQWVKSKFDQRHLTVFEEVVIAGRRGIDVAEELGTSPGWVYKAKCIVLAGIRDEFRDKI